MVVNGGRVRPLFLSPIPPPLKLEGCENMTEVNDPRKDPFVQDLLGKMSGKIEARCPISFAQGFYELSNKYADGINWILIKEALESHFEVKPQLDRIEESIESLRLQLLDLKPEKEKKEELRKEVKRMNDGTEVEVKA